MRGIRLGPRIYGPCRFLNKYMSLFLRSDRARICLSLVRPRTWNPARPAPPRHITISSSTVRMIIRGPNDRVLLLLRTLQAYKEFSKISLVRFVVSTNLRHVSSKRPKLLDSSKIIRISSLPAPLYMSPFFVFRLPIQSSVTYKISDSIS